MTEDTALAKWGYFFREGAIALGSKASFQVVKDKLQVQGLQEANFSRITENHIKVSLLRAWNSPDYLGPHVRVGQGSKV